MTWRQSHPAPKGGTLDGGPPGAAVLSLLFLFSLLMACTGDPPPEMMAEEFDESVASLQGEFNTDGEGKADLFGVSVCDVLRPIATGAGTSMRVGFFFGIETDAAFAAGTVYGGFDIVFDLYHHQMFVSRYYGSGVALALAGASFDVYAGVAVGFPHGVSDWNGYFVTADVELSLPFVREFLALNPSAFATAHDLNEDSIIDSTEVFGPPDGIYAFALGVEVGVNVPTGLPVGGSLVTGLWEPHDEATRWYYDLLATKHFNGVFGELNLHLVDAQSGEPCDPDWPRADTAQHCVIEFGEAAWSHTHRGLHVGYALCSVAGGCGMPLSWPMSAAAVGIGAVRDAGDDLREVCPDLAARMDTDT